MTENLKTACNNRRAILHPPSTTENISPSTAFPATPLLSIVLPVYNDTRFLEASINSVLQEQSISLELILVDDGSAEPLKVEQPDARIKLIRQNNLGISGALNTGFREASGVFLSWTSADNLYCPGALASLVKGLVSAPGTSLQYGNVRLISGTGLPLTDSAYRREDQDSSDRSKLLLPYSVSSLFEYDDNFINASFIFTKRAFDIIGGYRPGLHGIEDFDFWLRLTAFLGASHLPIDDVLYLYRLHDRSLTSTLDAELLASRTRDLRRAAQSVRQSLAKLTSDDEITSALNDVAPNAFRSGVTSELALRERYSFLSDSLKFTPREIGVNSVPLLNPMAGSSMLLRARDSDFHSLESSELNGLKLLVFPPTITSFERNNQITKFAIEYVLAKIPDSKAWIINFPFSTSLDYSSTGERVRQISITDEECRSHPDPSYYLTRALMFLLSSSDAIVYPFDATSDAALELRYIATLAAMAGRNVLVPFNSKANMDSEVVRTLTAFTPASHIHFVSDTERIHLDIGCPPTASSLDSFLYKVGRDNVSRELLTARYSRELARVFPPKSNQIRTLWQKLTVKA